VIKYYGTIDVENRGIFFTEGGGNRENGAVKLVDIFVRFRLITAVPF